MNLADWHRKQADSPCFTTHLPVFVLRYGEPVILEHALLPVVAGREAEFEAAFAEAKAIISAMPGFIDLQLSRSIETPNEYLLLVHWESVEAHEQGFRGSAEYGRWRALLHHFYEPFPVVEHFAEVAGTRA
ncbi:MAG TPA: antibiotic biosynthesis monooxygenase [Agromyces sp.]|nr:antibiotic biosynthesis monooxygenase [Agromyces sp.]